MLCHTTSMTLNNDEEEEDEWPLWVSWSSWQSATAVSWLLALFNSMLYALSAGCSLIYGQTAKYFTV